MHNINPFFVTTDSLSGRQTPIDKPGWAKLPAAPLTASPVPHLTSIYHLDDNGEYGHRGYAGNCGGSLIRDLFKFFKPRLVLDPMSGSGTCKDVCRDLAIECKSGDIHEGFDATNREAMQRLAADGTDFIWAHPPYWRMKLYADDSRDLSRARTLGDFLSQYAEFIDAAASVLSPGGRIAILMGDYPDREAGFVPLVYHTKRLAFAAGLRQCCTDIIRFSHGTTSSRKVYRTSFIPTLHDVCTIFERTMP